MKQIYIDLQLKTSCEGNFSQKSINCSYPDVPSLNIQYLKLKNGQVYT